MITDCLLCLRQIDSFHKFVDIVEVIVECLPVDTAFLCQIADPDSVERFLFEGAVQGIRKHLFRIFRHVISPFLILYKKMFDFSKFYSILNRHSKKETCRNTQVVEGAGLESS